MHYLEYQELKDYLSNRINRTQGKFWLDYQIDEKADGIHISTYLIRESDDQRIRVAHTKFENESLERFDQSEYQKTIDDLIKRANAVGWCVNYDLDSKASSNIEATTRVVH